MEKIKIGIIGTGSISVEHIEAYLKNSMVELYAFCDLNENRLNTMAEKYNIKHTFTDLSEMLKLKEIDAVSVCTWNSAHAPCAIAALDAGKHVLCEKPMSVSEEAAKAMKESAERNGKLLMIGFVRRYGNDCKILREFIDSDYFGDLYYAKATYLRRKGNPGGWFGDKSRSGGGPLIDLGVHVIDLVRFLMGNPKPVSVYGATFKKLSDRKNIKGKKFYRASSASENDICDVEDLATAMIRFDNGAVLSIEASFSLNIKKDEGKIELFGTKGGAKLNPELELYSEINDYLADVSLDAETSLSFDGLFAEEINHFVSCILDGTPCISPAQDGIEIMAILDAIYKSAETGHEVIL
ncbi:Gfo/Idh/MocA family oxidoreductase [Anaerocolumna sp. AGMB13025]|uniref:Gfo/Idh/MocA family protein n=1 Tax=Anaerocolumna sp. AGMB13025 TaxID=3039116 RepID=UPI00241FA9BD|nr:Gfo/Idh/MocA family oxidoreductase [Anaerocolumna sp. AGMB13025]WFR56675.1 Gfo/Idh/MocA family oxidoreductase [Anaerocolumna sp. AGMB13025]